MKLVVGDAINIFENISPDYINVLPQGSSNAGHFRKYIDLPFKPNGYVVRRIDSNAIYVENAGGVPIQTTIQNYIFKVGREGYKHTDWVADAASLYVFAPQTKD